MIGSSIETYKYIRSISNSGGQIATNTTNSQTMKKQIYIIMSKDMEVE